MTQVWDDPRVVEGLPRMLTSRAALVGEGATPIGWKVGFGAPASLELMQIESPVMGYMTDRTELVSGDVISMEGWSRPVVEFEVAVYMAADLGPDASNEEARLAVGSLGPAIEVADIDLTIEAAAVADVVAGNIFHKAVVLGQRDPTRAGLDISGLTARIVVDGVEHAVVTELEALTGSYPAVVRTVANTLASVGESLQAGDVIITGSVIPPLPGDAGSEFTFALEPFEAISIGRR